MLDTLSTVLQYAVKASLLIAASAVSLLYIFQDKLIYPSHMPPGSRTYVPTPHDFQIPAGSWEDLTLITPDNLKLKAFSLNHPGSNKTILMYHANAGNMGHRLPIAIRLYNLFKCNVFLVSYRGYGLSEGSPSEKGLVIDAQTALDYIYTHNPDAQVVLYGQSIGSAVAVTITSRNQSRIYGLIIENTFLSLPKLIPSVMPWIRHFTFLCNSKWTSDKSIQQILINRNTEKLIPILFLSGSKDELVPASHMKELHKLVLQSRREHEDKRVQWNEFRDGTHNDTFLAEGYFEAIVKFWKEFI